MRKPIAGPALNKPKKLRRNLTPAAPVKKSVTPTETPKPPAELYRE